MAGSSEFVPLTFALCCLSDVQAAEFHSDRSWYELRAWIAIRDAFTALVTPVDDAAAVRVELVSNDGARICGSFQE